MPIIITLFCLGFYSVSNYENALKCVFNTKQCQVVSKMRNAIVKIDGRESLNSKVFVDERRFYLISDAYGVDYFFLMTIDKSKNDVTLPDGCYATIYSSYLLLADCVHGIFYSDKVKAEGFDTKLKVTSSEIKFIIPDSSKSGLPTHNVEILFKGE